MNTKPQPYDIIPDIHGYAANLTQLLDLLGYRVIDGYYQHPERKVVFLGDFIDRGPAIRETLQIVKAMVDNKAALAVMGNHEYNAICYHTAAPADHPLKGDFYRPHTEKNIGQHEATLRAFEGRGDELAAYLKWFEKLPLFLDMDGFRVVRLLGRSRDHGVGRLNGYDAACCPPDADKDPRHAR